MSTTRLTFLYPHLFRSPRLRETASPLSEAVSLIRHKPRNRSQPPARCAQNALYATATSPKQSTFAARHGKAVEPLPVTGDGISSTPLKPPTSDPQKGERTEKEGGPQRPAAQGAATESLGTGNNLPSPEGSHPQPTTPPVIELGAPTPSPSKHDPAQADGKDGKKRASGPMDTLLHMEGPEAKKGTTPHLSPTSYVHHFDTYSLVKQLETGGYTQDQSITVMKAVRGLLALNLDVAQSGLVSRRDVDNETYLFRAACSELSTEVRNNRRIAEEQMRQQRTHVQHEVDISTQTLNQELLTLNDNVKGMFNDRRMAVREEQKANESAIQQINYKIGVILNSDAKSDIEGLRWVLIRRGVIGIIFMVFLSLGTLRYSSYLSHEKQKQDKRMAQESEELRKNGGKADLTKAPDAVEILAAN